MPHSDETNEPVAPARRGPDKGQPSRRSVLRGAAGAGAAGLAMTTLGTALAAPALAAPALAASHDRDEHAAAGDEGHDGEAVVVHVRDVRSGEMDVYRGTSHVQVTDRALAARLSRASR